MKDGKIEQTKGDQEFFDIAEEEKEGNTSENNGCESLRKW